MTCLSEQNYKEVTFKNVFIIRSRAGLSLLAISYRDDKVFLSRYIVVKANNNWEKRGGERVSFSSPQFSIQSKISKKNVFVPWVIC